MYPIECFNLADSNKVEAVRYYIELNKQFLKETSKEEYEVFADFLKGTGKDIMLKLSEAKTTREMVTLLNKIDRELPYAKDLSKYKDFEQKITCMHKKLALIEMRDLQNSNSASQVLKRQRQMASDYDKLLDNVKAYKDAVCVYTDLKNSLKDENTIKAVFASRFGSMGAYDIAEAIKSSLEKKQAVVKEKRNLAFSGITDYFVKEQIHVLEQENALSK